MATLRPEVIVGCKGVQWGSAATGLRDRQRQVQVGRETAVAFSAHMSCFLSHPCTRCLGHLILYALPLTWE